MVTRTLILVAVATALVPATAARAGDGDDDDGDGDGDGNDAAFNMLDTRFTIGTMPLDGTRTLAVSLGLGVEHPVFTKTRVFGEYELLWLSNAYDPHTAMLSPPPPERHGTGHRAVLGLRRELLGTGHHSVRGFVDGELGGGLALTNDNMRGFQTVPTGFVGLRAGYDIYSHLDSSPSRTFEFEILVRAIAVPDGLGWLTGLGFAWGN
jgi:hypothetical protein